MGRAAVPRAAELVAAVSQSILLEAGDISSDDQKNAAAMGAVMVAESLPEHKAPSGRHVAAGPYDGEGRVGALAPVDCSRPCLSIPRPFGIC